MDERSSRIGPYEPFELVSRGHRRELLRCRDPRDGSTVVVKLVRRNWTADETTQRRLLREFLIAQKAAHPGLIEIREHGYHEGAGFIVMRDYPAGSLAAHPSVGQRSDPRFALALVRGVAEALQCLHRTGHVHLDVKGSNILLDENLQPVLSDYGLSRSWRGLRRPRYLGGTPGFMSPEQAFLVRRRVDSRSDVFSLGVLLYELLTGELPFAARRRAEYFAALRAPPTWPAVIARAKWPAGLTDVLAHSLAFEPDERFASAGDMADSLNALLVEELPLPRA